MLTPDQWMRKESFKFFGDMSIPLRKKNIGKLEEGEARRVSYSNKYQLSQLAIGGKKRAMHCYTIECQTQYQQGQL